MLNEERSSGTQREGTRQGRETELETDGGDSRNGISCIISNKYTL